MQLQRAQDRLKAAGLTVVAVSVDPEAKNIALKKRLGITAFELYSDHGGAASKAWKLFDADTEISRVATYVIAPDGKVLYRHEGADKTDRPSIEDILAGANSAKQKDK